MADEKNLKKFQEQFMKALFPKEEDHEFASSIVPGGKLLNSSSALMIHQRGYICRLTEALGEIYEGVWSALGDKEFFRLSEEYILSHPSFSYNLSDYGGLFGQFLISADVKNSYPFIVDLAKLDYAFHSVFHLPQHNPLEINRLQELEADPYKILKFGETVSLIELNSRVYEIWKNREHRIQKNYDFRGKEYLVIYKQNGHVFVSELQSQGFNLLSALKSGISLGTYLDENELPLDDLSSLFYFIASAGLVNFII